MKKIHFTYKHHINIHSITAWEKHIFEETYHEFLIQHYIFQKENLLKDNFLDLLKTSPEAKQLHHLLDLRIHSSIDFLHNNVYKIIDHLEQKYLQFINYRFELIQSHTNDKNQHQIAIYFLSKEYILHNEPSTHYLVSLAETEDTNTAYYETLQFPTQPYFNISLIKK